MIITAGDKVHIVTRRLFETDLRRHCAGIVQEVSDDQIKARGYVFVFDESQNEFVRRDDERVRIFPISDSGLIVNLLPKETDVDNIRYRIGESGCRTATDGRAMSLNVSEFGAKR